MDVIRWGIIGCGSVTELKSGPALQKAGHSQLVAVCRRTLRLAEDYAKRHGVPKWYQNPIDLVQDPDVDAVYVATPPNSHKEFALLAACAGKPVYVEKPMATTWEDCQEMITVCKNANVPLLVAFYRRKLPRFLLVKELLEEIGNIRFVNVLLVRGNEERYQDPDSLPWTVTPAISGGGLFVDLGSHTLDLLDFLLGPIAEVVGFADNQIKAYPAEDCVALSFKFECGAYGTGVWNFCAHGRYDKVEFFGENGTLAFATFGDSAIELTLQGKNKQIFHTSNPVHIQQPLIESVVGHIRGEELCPSTGDSAARTQKIIDIALSSYRKAHRL